MTVKGKSGKGESDGGDGHGHWPADRWAAYITGLSSTSLEPPMPTWSRSSFAALTCVALAALPLAAQQNFDTVQVRPVRVAEGIYMLTGSGGNIGVSLGDDGTLLIDDQFAPLTAKIQAAVRGLTSQSIKYLINTHWHGDHVGGNENFGNAGVLILAHDNVRGRMAKEQFVPRLNRTMPASPKVALPIVTFPETLSVHVNGEDIVAFHVRNAHTDGDVLVRFTRANVIHAGDVFVRYGYPFIDESSGGTFLGLLAATETLLSVTNAETKYIPGHGNLGTRADVETYRKLLVTIRDRVQAAVKAKKSLKDLLAAKPLADYDAQFGPGGFVKSDDILTMAYGELTMKK
jgi:cyclase